MIHFIERKHLLQWLTKNCARKVVVRAMDEGAVEHLGSFTALGPNGDPGWIVKVISNSQKVWFVEIVSSVHSRRFGIFIPKDDWRIPWECWNGCPAGVGNSLYNGDDPYEYARLRDKRRTEINERN